MVTREDFAQMCLSLPLAEEKPHFENTSFRVKKIFATLQSKANIACLKLTPAQQDIYSLAAPGIIYPVPNKWGQQGWTLVNLDAVEVELLTDAMNAAYANTTASKR